MHELWQQTKTIMPKRWVIYLHCNFLKEASFHLGNATKIFRDDDNDYLWHPILMQPNLPSSVSKILIARVEKSVTTLLIAALSFVFAEGIIKNKKLSKITKEYALLS